MIDELRPTPPVRVNGAPIPPCRHRVEERCTLCRSDPPPQPDPPPAAAWRYPRDEQRSLETHGRDLDERFAEDAEQAPALEYRQVLERLGLRPHDVDGEGESGRSPVERAVLGGLVEVFWGVIPTQVLLRNTRPPRRGPREAVFMSLRSMLTWYVTTPAPLLGMGDMRLEIAEDSDATVRARRHLARRGRARPLDADGRQLPGWLPDERMPAKQTRGGCIGGTKGLSVRELKIDIERALGAAKGVDQTTWDALFAVEVGEWQASTLGEKAGRHTGRELVRVRVGEFARRLPRGDEKGAATRLSHRLRNARYLVTEAAVRCGLLPQSALRRAARSLPTVEEEQAAAPEVVAPAPPMTLAEPEPDPWSADHAAMCA